MNGWLNIYKPKAISSAKVVSIVKKIYKDRKIGHAGTLDVEAEGILPIAVGEATKLMQFLVDAHKEYIFTIKFGAKTDSADYTGKIIATTAHIPNKEECDNISSRFIGIIEQIPPAYSALKVNGIRSYELARKNNIFTQLASRKVQIYHLKCLGYDEHNLTATYIAQCSKGTYIRTLGEDIALSLQSLGFVIELRRTEVGVFKAENALIIADYESADHGILKTVLDQRLQKVETVLGDIPVLDVGNEQAAQIKFGQVCRFPYEVSDGEKLWVRYQGILIAIGRIKDNCFKSSRVFNLV